MSDTITDPIAETDRIAQLEAKIDVLTDRVAVLVDDVDRRAQERKPIDEFVADVVPLGPGLMATVTEGFAEAERRGYVTFARAGGRMADRVVTSFDEDDLDQLADNVVTILETVREVTQPELLALLGRMVDAVNAEQAAMAIDDGEAPSFWAIAKELRDPDVRRGMSRALHTLRAVSATTSHPSVTATNESPTTDLTKGEQQ